MKNNIILAAGILLMTIIASQTNASSTSEQAFPTESKVIFDACFSAHGQVLFIADDTSIKAWSFDNRKLMREFRGGHKAQVMSVACSSDSTLLVSADRESVLVLWDMVTGEILHSFETHAGIILSVAISGDNRYLASGATDNALTLYDLQEKKVINRYEIFTDDITSVKFSPGDRWLAAAGAGGKVVIVDMRNREICSVLSEHNTFIRDIGFVEASIISSVGDNGKIYTWSGTSDGTFRLRTSSRVSYNWITSLDRIPGKIIVVTSDIRGRIAVTSPFGKMTKDLKIPVNKILFRPDGSINITIVAATLGQGVVVIKGSEMKAR